MSEHLTHPGGARVELPDGWEPVVIDAGSVVGLEPSRDGFRANVVLTLEALEGRDFADWQNGVDAILPGSLDDYLLLDLERCEVAGLPGGRRLAHHVGPGGEALVLEQWFTAVGDVGCTVTVTVDVRRYPLLADPSRAIADTLVLPLEAR